MAGPLTSNDRRALYAAVGAKVRASRGKRLTQAQLADRLNLSRTSITNIEAGRQQLLLHTLLELAQVLQVDLLDLLPPPGQMGTARAPASATAGQPPRVQDWVKLAMAPRSRNKRK